MLDFIFLVGIIQGLFLIIAFSLKFFKRQKKNPFFLVLISLITLALVSKYLFTIDKYYVNPWVWYYADFIAYLIGSLWFYTISKSIRPEVHFSWKDAALLSPILFHVGFIIHIHSLSKEELLSSSNELWFEVSFILFCVTVFMVNTSFLYRSHRLIREYRGSKFPEFIVRGQYGFIFIFGIWLVAFLITLLLEIRFLESADLYTYAFASLSFLILFVALLSMVRPEFFHFLTQTYDSDEKEMLRDIAARITEYIESKKPYLSHSFSLLDLSDQIKSNQVLTSKAINQILESNFNELVNSYRIEHFTKLAKEEAHKNFTLWGIAQESGFVNKSTFYTAFKKVTGLTPKAYLNSISNEV